MDKAYSYLVTDVKLKYGDIVVVAVSGGPDSMALLDLLKRIKEKIEIEVICAHVNHNTGRPGQFEEQKFVGDYCKKNDIVFETMTIEDYGDDNFHNEARTKRYNYFGKLVKEYNAKYLFTAHHGDDLIETILMRIVRGSTLRGYSGFSKRIEMDGYTILRPLIELSKDEIKKYNIKHNIPFAEDSSNKKDVYTRNRFRKYIVPEFRKEDPNIHQKFYKFSRTLLEYNDYINKEVAKILPTVYKQNILDIDEFLKLDHLIAMKVIYNILESVYQDDLMLITDQHAELIYNLVKSKKANTYIYLPNNLKAIKQYNTLSFATYQQADNEYEIEIINYLNLPNGHIIQVLNDCSETGNDVCYLNSKDIKLPLRARTRRDGDKIAVKNMVGRKKVNDIFIDEKITVHERDMWPVVVDSNNEVVWLPNLKKSKFDKTKEENYDIILKYY